MHRTAALKTSFHRRLAVVWLRLGGLPEQALGRTLGAVFLIKGVRGLPDANGNPAEEVSLDGGVQAVIRRLPLNYLEDRAEGIYRKLKAWTSLPDDVLDETVSRWLLRFVVLDGMRHMEEGLSLSSAVAYVVFGLRNEALNQWKKYKREREYGSVEEGDADLVADPEALRRVVKRPVWEAPAVRRQLEKVHPDVPLFLDLLMEGYPAKHIVMGEPGGDGSMLPHFKERPMTYPGWHQGRLPQIIRILSENGGF